MILRIIPVVATLALVVSCRSHHDVSNQPPPAASASLRPPPQTEPPESTAVDTATLDTTVGSTYVGRGGHLIDSIFKRELGESPRMGWLVPGKFFATERHPQLHVWSTGSEIVPATFVRALSSQKHKRISQEWHLACDSQGPLGEYSMKISDLGSRGRAFYTSAAPVAGTQVGLLPRSLTSSELSAAHALLADHDSGARYLDTAFTVPQSRTFYSVDAVFDTAGVFVRSALVLHDSMGAIVASKIDNSKAFSCDGCGDPTYDEGFWRLYDVNNGFVVPGFPYPILLLDTSTVEGRALSLVTFGADGAYAVYRIYEYVVGCILGPE